MAEEALDDRALSESMDEDIRKTLAAIKEREPEALDVTEDAPAVKDDRARAPDGKFVKTESAAPAEAPDTSPPVGVPEQAAVDAPVEGAQPAVDLNRAPSSWKPAAKAAWQALPEPVRAEIHRREFDFHNTTFKGPLKENADFGQSVRQVVEPYKAMIEAEGGTPERAIADTMRTAALFRTGTQEQKLQALWQIDKQFNGGLAQHFERSVQAEIAKRTGQPAVEGQPPVYQDPRVDTILQSLQEQERQRQEQERQRQQEQEQQNANVVQEFINAKGTDGQPLYPFVDNVIADMSARVQLIRQQNPALNPHEALKQAYEQASWANPEVRAVLISQQQAQANKPEDNLRRVEQAKRASAVNVPKRGALPASGPALSLEEDIRETARALGMF